MPRTPFYQPRETTRLFDRTTWDDKTERDIWSLGFSQQADEDIASLASFELPRLEMPEPLDVVVSDRPDAMQIREQQQAPARPFGGRPAPMPEAPAASAIPGPDVSPESGTPIRSAGEMAPEIAAAGAGSPTGYTPSSARGAEGVERWSDLVTEAARTYNLPESTIKGLMEIESGGNPSARSSAGALGLMQVMPFHFGQGEDGMDPRTNILRGAKVYADALRRWGDPDKAAAAYFGAIDGQGNITNATDGSSVDGPTYVRLWRTAAAKYGGTPSAPTRANPDVRTMPDTPANSAGMVPENIPLAPNEPPLTGSDDPRVQRLPGPPASPNAGAPPASAAPPSAPGAPAAPVGGAGAPEMVVIEEVDAGGQGGRRMRVPRSEVPRYTSAQSPGMPPLWRVVDDGRQSMSALDEARASSGGGQDLMLRGPLSQMPEGAGAEPYDPRDADQGAHEAGPLPYSPLSPNPEPVTPEPPTVTITQGGPPAPGGVEVETETRPRQNVVVEDGRSVPSYSREGEIEVETRPRQQPAPVAEQSWRGPALQTGMAPAQTDAEYAVSQAIGSGSPTVREVSGGQMPLGPQYPTTAPREPVMPPEPPSSTPVRDDWRTPTPEPLGPAQQAISDIGRSRFLNEPAAAQAVDIYNAISELPFEAYEAARRQVISDYEARGMAGTDPLAPFRPIAAQYGITLPSARDINPEGRPASDVFGGLLIMGALPDPADPFVQTALVAAGKTLGLTARGVRAGARMAAPVVESGARAVGRGVRGLADTAADAPGVQSLGSGVVPDGSRRMYHGTAGAFERPDPGRFDPGGTFGPGYYVASNPRAADVYADIQARGGPTHKTGRPLADEPIGANTRAVDVPETARLFDIEGIEGRQAAEAVHSALERLDPQAAASFRDGLTRFDKQGRKWIDSGEFIDDLTGERIYERLESVLIARAARVGERIQDSKAVANRILAEVGYDGISFDGRRRVGMVRDGEVVPFTSNVIFPESLDKIRNAFSGEQGGAGFIPSRLPPGLRADAFNAAQGGVLGGASESLEAGAEGRDADPAEMARRGAMGAALAIGGGRFARRGGPRLGSGAVPQPNRPTVEVIAERLDAAKAAARAARASGDLAAERAASDEMWSLTDQLADAMNARRDLEPRITSDVGRRLETVPPAEESVDDLAGIGRERVRPEDAANLGGPASVPVRPITLGSGFVPGGGTPMSPGVGPNRATPNLAASAAQVASAAQQGARRGARLNAPLSPRSSAVPPRVRAATKLTDDRAAMRWAEDMLTDAAGSPRLAENDVARPSTQSRVNAGAVAEERIASELEPAVMSTARAGLQDELTQHLDDMHARDVLNDAYHRARDASLAEQQVAIERIERQATTARDAQRAAEQKADAAAAVGGPAHRHDAVASRYADRAAKLEAEAQALRNRADTVADMRGQRELRAAQGRGADEAYEAIDARIRAQEERLKASGQWDALQESAGAIWEHNRQTLRRLRDAGRISQQELDDLEAAFPHYVPTRQVQRLDPNGADTGAFLGAPTLQGERLNPIVSSRNLTLTGEREIQRNQVFTSFNRLFEAAEGAGGITRGPEGVRRLWDGDKDVSGFIDGVRTTIRVPAPVADGLEAAANMGTSGNVVAAIWKRIAGVVTSSITAGRASFLPVNLTRDLQDYATRTLTLEGGNVARLPSIVGTWLDEAGKAAADIARAQANVRGVAGAGSGAIAGAAAGDEDTTIGERIRNAGAGAVAGTFLVGANRARVTGAAREFGARGGGSGPINPGWRAGQRWYRDVIRDAGQPITSPSEMANFLRDWGTDILSLRGVKGINERTELISRTAAMRRAEARGAPVTEAMLAGRDVTYDPDRAGTVIRAANGIVPFLNATVQSGAQLARLGRDHPVALGTTIASTVAPAMLAFEAWNRSEPERAKAYDDVPQYIKDTGLVVMLPWSGSDNRGERPNYLWIPTGLATPFVIGMRSALQNVPGLEPSAGRADVGEEAGPAQRVADVLWQALQVFSPVKGESAAAMASSFVPPGVKQGVELGLNRDLYRANPIVTDVADERASAFSRGVAGAANAAGRMIGNDPLQNVRPSAIEYGIRQLPAYGDIITGASDMIAPSGYKRAEERPIQNAPFLGGIAGRFVRDTGGANLERIQQDRLPDSVRPILEAANMRPDEVGTVPGRFRGATLTRDEQERWQRATNRLMGDYLIDARNHRDWQDRTLREEIIRKAIAKAKTDAALDVLNLTPADIKDRIGREEAVKRASR